VAIDEDVRLRPFGMLTMRMLRLSSVIVHDS
jgi:hypothetical protein